MKDKLKQLRNGGSVIAQIASGPFGNRIAFAPDDGGGAGGAGGDDAGGNDDDAGGSDKGGKPDDQGGRQDDQSPKGGKKFRAFGRQGQDDDSGGQDDAGGNDGADGRPDHVPAKFWDAEAKAVKADEMAKAYADLEKAHGKLKRSKGYGEAPESPDDYFADGFETPEAADKIQASPDDPGLQRWAKVAHKYGLPTDIAVNIARDMIVEFNEFAPDPIDPEMEEEALGPNGKAIVAGVETWLDSLDEQGLLSDDDAEVALKLMETAKGVKFLRAVRAAAGGRPIPVVPGKGAASMTPQAFDEAYKKAVADKDYAERERLDAMRDEVFGGARHNTSVNVG